VPELALVLTLAPLPLLLLSRARLCAARVWYSTSGFEPERNLVLPEAEARLGWRRDCCWTGTKGGWRSWLGDCCGSRRLGDDGDSLLLLPMLTLLPLLLPLLLLLLLYMLLSTALLAVAVVAAEVRGGSGRLALSMAPLLCRVLMKSAMAWTL